MTKDDKMTGEKIKIVHLITKLELGGAQVNTIYTYEHLDEEQFETFLISGPGGILTEKVEKKERFIIIDSLIRAIHPLKDLKAFFQLRKILKEIRPQVLHTHSSKAGLLGRAAGWALRIPAVIHSVHGFPFSPFQSVARRTVFTLLEKIASHFTGHFIFVARDDIEIAKNKKIIKKGGENYSLIRSGFPFAQWRPQRTEAEIAAHKREMREKHHIPDDAFVIGIIAPFKPQKGLFHLIEIAHRVLTGNNSGKNIMFIITGDGALREPIETALKEKGIFQNFRLPGFLFDVYNTVDIFDIGVSTALWEGLPQSLVQLRLKKKAVVASDICGNREVIVHDQNGYLVEVTHYDVFAARILELVADDDRRNRLAQYPDDYAQWDAHTMVKRQEELYKRLLNGQMSEH